MTFKTGEVWARQTQPRRRKNDPRASFDTMIFRITPAMAASDQARGEQRA
jgi:hypothetical protein